MFLYLTYPGIKKEPLTLAIRIKGEDFLGRTLYNGRRIGLDRFFAYRNVVRLILIAVAYKQTPLAGCVILYLLALEGEKIHGDSCHSRPCRK